MATATLQSEVDNALPSRLESALQQVCLGTILTPLKIDTGTITATSTLTLAAALAAAGLSLPAPLGNTQVAPAIGWVKTLRVVTSGTGGSVGSYIVSDAGGTAIVPPGGASAAVGVALLSDDGTTITFPNTVTRVVMEVVPRPATAMTTTVPQ